MFTIFEALKDLLFPPHCLGCGQQLDNSRPPLICSGCESNIECISSPLCTCCGMPFAGGSDHFCGDCLAGTYAFDLARSLLRYRPPASNVILSMKFHGNLAGMSTLAALLTRTQLLNSFHEPELILPVPLHVDRLRQRGFNQAVVIIKYCLPQWKKKIETGVLLRPRMTTPQSLLSGKERRSNLKNTFSLADPGKVNGRNVLLVDDVFTTGSTINECSKVLRAAGAKRIEVFTVARSLVR